MAFFGLVNRILQGALDSHPFMQSPALTNWVSSPYTQTKRLRALGFSVQERQRGVHKDSVLEIIAHGAWNGGTVQDNSLYENKGMVFKGDIPVNDKTIQDRIGVKTRGIWREVLDLFAREGIEIPFPQRVMHHRGADPAAGRAAE